MCRHSVLPECFTPFLIDPTCGFRLISALRETHLHSHKEREHRGQQAPIGSRGVVDRNSGKNLRRVIHLAGHFLT